MTSAVSWFNALQKRRANEIQDEFNRKQEELQQAQIRHGTFGAQLSAVNADIQLNENKLREAYQNDPQYIKSLNTYLTSGFTSELPLSFYQKTFRPEIMNYGMPEFLDRVGATQTLFGNANLVTVSADSDEKNFKPIVVNKAGGGDGSRQVIAVPTEGAKELQFGGIPYKLSNDATGYFLNSYLRKLGQTTKGYTGMGDITKLNAALTGNMPDYSTNTLSELTASNVDDADAIRPGPVLAKLMEDGDTSTLTTDDYNQIYNDPYLKLLIEGQEMTDIDDLGTISSMADQGMYSGINRRIIENSWTEYERAGPNTTLGKRTNNPLNLPGGQKRMGEGGAVPEGNALFTDPIYGIRAAEDELKSYKKAGVDTIEKVIQRWPSSAGKTEGQLDPYVKFVADQLGISPNDKINLDNPDTREQLLTAMVQIESPDFEIGRDQIAASRDISVVAYRGLESKKEFLSGLGYQSSFRKGTLNEQTLPFMSFTDGNGNLLRGDDLFEAVMGGFTQKMTGTERDARSADGIGTPATFIEGVAETGDSDLLGSEDALIINQREELKSYFYKEGAIPFDLNADQFDSLTARQKNLMYTKARQVTNTNVTRIKNNIIDQKDLFSDANKRFYSEFFSGGGPLKLLGSGTQDRSRRQFRSNRADRLAPKEGKSMLRGADDKFTQKSLEDFFTDNPEYGREFFALGSQGFAEKYQNDPGFAKNFPTNEDIRLENQRLEQLKIGANRELANILLNRVDPNTDKGDFKRLNMEQRFRLLQSVYTNQVQNGGTLISQEHYTRAMQSFQTTGIIDLGYATRGTSKSTGKSFNSPVTVDSNFGEIQPIIDKYLAPKVSPDGDLLDMSLARYRNLIFDSDVARNNLIEDPTALEELNLIMAFKERNYANPEIQGVANEIIQRIGIGRMIGLADPGLFNLLTSNIQPEDFEDTRIQGAIPTVSVQLQWGDMVIYPRNLQEANIALQNGAKLKGYQLYRDDGTQTGKFVEADDIKNDFDKRFIVSALGVGINSSGSNSRTSILQTRLQAQEDANLDAKQGITPAQQAN